MPKQVSLLLSISIFLCSLFAGDVNAETWKITSLDWPPYAGPDLPNQGLSIDKLRQLLKQEGIELVVEFYPWLRAQHYAKSEEYVGYFPAWPEEVKEEFIGSPAVDYSSIGVLTYSGSNSTWSTIDALFRDYNVGIIQTYVYPQEIQRAVQQYPKHVDYAPDETSLVKKLSAKRTDVALTDPKVMLYIAAKENIDNIVVLEECLEQKALMVAFRNDQENQRRIERLKRALETNTEEK